MARTDRADFTFTVKEFADGTPWIMLEPSDKNAVKMFNDGFIGFDLPKGTDLQKAREIAKYMRVNLGKLAMTTGLK